MRVMRPAGQAPSLGMPVRTSRDSEDREEVGGVPSGPDVRVHDRVALDEIELYGELVIAASSSDEPLSEDQIDLVLGLDPDDYPG